MNLIDKLENIQKKLNAPKAQYNSFGGYKYKSCEDIFQAIKPLIDEFTVIVSDEIICINDRVYVKATAKILDKDGHIECSAYAREPFDKKGMDASQITGAASSYARKYALNGLFLIDDNKDADSRDNSVCKKSNEIDNELSKLIDSFDRAKNTISNSKDLDSLSENYRKINKYYSKYSLKHKKVRSFMDEINDLVLATQSLIIKNLKKQDEINEK
jgi:hypothetical protein